VDVSGRAEYAQVVTVSIIAIKPHATVTGDTAVHFMTDERPQILVAVGALAAAEAAHGVIGHDGHVLQMAFAAFLAHGAIVRVVDHQPLDDFLAEFSGSIIRQRNACAVLGRGHAGHDDAALGIVFVGVLGDRALAA